MFCQPCGIVQYHMVGKYTWLLQFHKIFLKHVELFNSTCLGNIFDYYNLTRFFSNMLDWKMWYSNFTTKTSRTILECFFLGTMCNYCCSPKSSMKIHMTSVHENKKPHKCLICDYNYSRKGDLKQHVESIHENKKPHKCSICEKMFSRMYRLSSHLKSIHEKTNWIEDANIFRNDLAN